MVVTLDRQYKYEVRTAAGALVNKLPYAHEGKLIQQVNEPAKLIFKSPIGETGTASIIKANEIYLTDPNDNVQVFRMINRKHVRDADNIPCIEFTGYDYLAQLGEEQVLSYNATILDALTIAEIIDDLFALQLNANPITVGTIASAIGDEVREILINNQSILQCIRTLQTSVGGYFWINEDREFNWAVSQGNNTGQQIRYGKNATGISRDEDYSQLCTRLYAYGIGEGGVRLDLTDAGEANEYLEGTTQATYGIVPKLVFFKSTLYADFLLAQAQMWLDEHENPIYKYEVDFTDLSMLDDNFSFDALAIGSKINVVDEDLGIDNDVYITRIDRDLDNPEDVKMDLSSAPEVVTNDVTSLLAEKAKLLEGGDVVIVSHDQIYINKTTIFTSFLNGSQTAINGSHIEVSSGTVFDGIWYSESGVEIDAGTGIDCYGQDMAFTTSKLVGTSITSAATADAGASVTFTTAAAHGMEIGDQVVLRGMSVAAYNGKYTITEVASTTTFKVTLTYSATATGYAYQVQCSVDSDGNIKAHKFESLSGEGLFNGFWNGIQYGVRFDSLDGFASSGTSLSNGKVLIDGTGATAYLNKTFPLCPVTETWDKNRRMKSRIYVYTYEYQTIYITCALIIPATSTSNHIGFIIEDNLLKGICADGSTQSKTGTLATLTSFAGGRFLTLEAVLYSGNKVVYYVNGAYAAELTTNIPSGPTNAIGYINVYVTDDNPGAHGGRSVGIEMSEWRFIQEP